MTVELLFTFDTGSNGEWFLTVIEMTDDLLYNDVLRTHSRFTFVGKKCTVFCYFNTSLVITEELLLRIVSSYLVEHAKQIFTPEEKDVSLV